MCFRPDQPQYHQLDISRAIPYIPTILDPVVVYFLSSGYQKMGPSFPPPPHPNTRYPKMADVPASNKYDDHELPEFLEIILPRHTKAFIFKVDHPKPLVSTALNSLCSSP